MSPKLIEIVERKNVTTNESGEIELPPRLPADETELHLAVTLLGNRKQSELGARARQNLERLLGVYPTVKEAARWKRILRRVYQTSASEMANGENQSLD